jgi:glucose-1-phosphate adenylyltransferase
LPASKVLGARLESALLSEGCILEREVQVRRAVLGLRSVVRRGSSIAGSVILGASTYEKHGSRERPRLGIGEGCSISNAIIDSDARIGDGVVLENRARHEQWDGDSLFVRDGIVVVPRGAVIPDGFVF